MIHCAVRKPIENATSFDREGLRTASLSPQTNLPPGSSRHIPNVAGMVASIDRWLGQWPAVLRMQSEARLALLAGGLVIIANDSYIALLSLWRSISLQFSFNTSPSRISPNDLQHISASKGT